MCRYLQTNHCTSGAQPHFSPFHYFVTIVRYFILLNFGRKCLWNVSEDISVCVFWSFVVGLFCGLFWVCLHAALIVANVYIPCLLSEYWRWRVLYSFHLCSFVVVAVDVDVVVAALVLLLLQLMVSLRTMWITNIYML